MYTEFFGLKRNPFELSPDPSFMFPSEEIKEALAAISYAIVQRKGFVVMTGEVGTGKTLIVRSLFEWWRRERIAFANIFAPKLSVIDFLTYATSDLGIEVNEPSKGNLLRALHGFVVAQFEKGLTTVLVIDEAHQIPTNMLEEIRMLTNLETDQQKLVQVLLVGQPELDKKLDSFELRQLKQRIAVRCHLEPLREEQTRHYIERRLNLAGASAEAKTIFPPETTKVIYRCSQGIPRLINSVCDRALITADTRQIRVVPVEIINEVASYFRLQPSSDLRETLSSLSHQAGELIAAMSRQPTTAVSASAAKATDPDTLSTGVDVRCGTSAEATPPSKPKSLYEDSLRNIPGVAQPELSTPPRAAAAAEKQLSGNDSREFRGLDLAPPNTEPRAILLPSDRSALSAASTTVTGPAETRPSTPIQYSPPATESIPCQSDQTLHDTRPDKLRRRLKPVLHLPYKQDHVQGWARQWWTAWEKALLISAGAIVVVGLAGLATSAVVARRQNRAVTVLHQVASASETFQAGPTIVSRQAAGGSSSLEFNAGSADPIVPRSDIEISKPAGRPEYSTHRREIVIGTLSRPVLKSARPSISTEPPLIMGMETSELPLGNDLLASSGPTPPGASSGGHLQPPKLVSSPPLVYPSRARIRNLQGVVVIDALVDATGKVADMTVISGPPSLVQAAMDALRTWKYEPARLNGQPIAIHMQVSINFRVP
jgi:general secretion pathway protein A